MSGAIAGTAILKALNLTDRLQTVTLTINNDCNLSCPHCYLQYQSSNRFIDGETLDSVLKADFKHLVIVGKEPLANQLSVSLVEQAILRSSNSKKTVSLVTNGLGLRLLNFKALKHLDYIDVSFDGGPKSYQEYRKGSFDSLVSEIRFLETRGYNHFNALHVLNDATMDFIDDMIEVDMYCHLEKIMFSPYLVTSNFGKNYVNPIKLQTMFEKLSESSRFMNCKKAFLLLDLFHLLQESMTFDEVEELIARYSISEKIKLIKYDPLEYGIIRVTYDGYVLSPYESMHTLYYRNSAFRLVQNDLNTIFGNILSRHLDSNLHGNQRT